MAKSKFLATALLFMSLLTIPLVQINGQQPNGGIVRVSVNSQLGEILTDPKGMTLYLFTPDQDNLSTCYDQCAVLWPPLLIKDPSEITTTQSLGGKIGATKRKDNTWQVTYDGKPLYYYIEDSKPGDTFGQNVENKWYVVRPNSHQRQNGLNGTKDFKTDQN